MYIAEVTIEGFKSYASRVTLSNFDKSFNAITGLNGSGKSNVLDSICFVMGIKNLSNVRASSLQELVYKQGQAGITKATVSITWCNDDPANGPAGYTDKERITVTRQVVVGGRNKYQINGVAAQENRVQDFFHSVQLNVNNPHFLIMQGRITKVLNMKPPEILSLLEEAAGTRMYEKKKEGALRTLEKKQARLDQIDGVLHEDIQPTLEQLRGQCGQYHEWATLEAKKERLKRLLVANEYTECIKQGEAFAREAGNLHADLAKFQQQQEDILVQMSDMEDSIRGLETEKEIQSGGELKELQGDVDRLSMELTTSTTTWKSRQGALASEQAGLAGLQAQQQQLEAQDLPGQLKAAEEARDAAAAALESAQGAVEAAQRELAGAEAGDGRDHTNRSLKERLADAQRDVTTAEAEQKAAQVKAKLLASQLADSKKALAACGKEAAQAQAARAEQQLAIEQCQAKLQALGYDAARMAAVEAEHASVQAEVRAARDQVERLSQEVEGCNFRYSNPGGGFDAARVHGVLARLVRVTNPQDTLALEVAAGGKLWQVVVDDADTAKQLLQKARLQRRVTIIPLNKVQYPELSNGVKKAAEREGQGKAWPALQLVGYPEEVEAAVKYAFGNSFVSEDSGTAKALAFSRDVHSRCVTREGDDFNPSGLLTGGKRNTNSSVLGSLAALAQAEAALGAAQAKLQALGAELQAASGKARQHRKLDQELALAQHSLKLLEERLAGTQAAQFATTCESLTTELAEAEAVAQTSAQRKAQLMQLCKELEHESNNFGCVQKARIKEAQAKLKAAKAALDKAKAAAKAAEAAVVKARAELEGADEEQAGLAAKVAEAQAACAALEQEVGGLEAQVNTTKQAYGAADGLLRAKRDRMKECDKDISALHKKLHKLSQEQQKLEAEGRKAETRMKQKAGNAARLQERVAQLEKDYEWVNRDKAQFGSGDYDFSGQDMPRVQQEYLAAQERCGQLKGKVNSKVIDKLKRAESEYEQLMDKRRIVENDRQRIEQVIEELDDKKRQAMESTWEKVNMDFGAIFSALLPGTQAKLQPQEGCSFLEGLEVRVAFGGVWKSSLTELSGGQRSLLALSLILALCKFKPAPLYILDEVDSALDLNHTQNIGRMIREHFPQSQFLVVSLKEGMFSNANVIFRTKFVDGVSTITRTVPTQQELAMRGAQLQENEATRAAGKGAAAAGKAAHRRPLLTLNS